MSKKKDLASALRAQDETAPHVRGQGSDNSPASLASQDTAKSSAKGRTGMVNIAGWFPAKVKFELEELRLERSRKAGRKITLQQIQAEAYNDLFKKYGRAELAPSS